MSLPRLTLSALFFEFSTAGAFLIKMPFCRRPLLSTDSARLVPPNRVLHCFRGAAFFNGQGRPFPFFSTRKTGVFFAYWGRFFSLVVTRCSDLEMMLCPKRSSFHIG